MSEDQPAVTAEAASETSLTAVASTELSDSDQKSIIIHKNDDEEVIECESVNNQNQNKQKHDEDLEDGEIDDDDDDDDNNDEGGNDSDKNKGDLEGTVIDVNSKSVAKALPIEIVPAFSSAVLSNKPTAQSIATKNMMTMNLIDEMGKKSKSKSRRDEVIEDDFAGSIESAIAAALKKDGIMPPRPKILETREESDRKIGDKYKEVSLSKSGRRRKRRKLRDERDKEKEKDKKKQRLSQDTAKTVTETIEGEELDDDEMLCVRGGSPPPVVSMLPIIDPTVSKKDPYDSDGSYTSYDSYDSAPNYQRYSTRKKDSTTGGGLSGSRSKRKERNRRDDERRSEKRSRRNYDDSGDEEKYQDRHPQQPRKLELCKFFLMECCAKKDKCSYMHSDFPCKYYYLGMDCVYKAACKFSHGKPLSDQLRNVLLKHLETAPKEILGTFRRISRENAINLMTATHEKICQEHGIKNTMAPNTSTTQTVIQTKANIRNLDIDCTKNIQSKQKQQEQQQAQQTSETFAEFLDMTNKFSQNTSANDSSVINSITLPTGSTPSNNLNSNKTEKQRKSRWCESNASVTAAAIIKNTNLEPPSSNAPSYLDLKNLTGILSSDRIEKLSKLGVVNLEQINQLTLSQLNKIGLTINEISEIQLNARNIAQLGVGVNLHSDVMHPSTNTNSIKTTSGPVLSSQDVDMRFLPSCLPITTTTITTSTTASENIINDKELSSTDMPSKQTSIIQKYPTSTDSTHLVSSKITGIDYSQYLRDSNLGYDKIDILDDEKDEEQLVIDDQDLDALDETSQINENKYSSDNELREINKFIVPCVTKDIRLPSSVHLSDKQQNTLKESVNFYGDNESELTAISKENSITPGTITNKPSLLKTTRCNGELNNFKDDEKNENNFYGSNSKSRNNRDRDSNEEFRHQRDFNCEEQRDPRHRHHNISLKDDYRDPRLSSSTSRSFSSSNSFKASADPLNTSLYNYKSSNKSDDDSDRDRDRDRDRDSGSRSRSRSRTPRSRSDSPRSRSGSRSRSQTPTHHENPSEQFRAAYERPSMYDWTEKCVQEDLEYNRRNTKADKDMRLSGFLDSSNSDIDLRLPFQPVKNIQIAKEIDGSMSTLSPISYKVYELNIPDPKYCDLRQSFQCEDTADPRLRRILGLPELSNSKVLAALGRSSRPTIASPSSVESSSSPTRSERERSVSHSSGVTRNPRVDPRRPSTVTSGLASSSLISPSSSASSSSYQAQISQLPSGNPQQNIEIRLILQKSEWYKNLNSKAKIMVNQQLALVSTELKRYHQNPSPNKVFDIQFIVNNQNLQEILTCLGIYIDDNGNVAHVESDNDNMMGSACGMGSKTGLGTDYCGVDSGGMNAMMMMNEANMNVHKNIAAVQGQMEFLRVPPPCMNNLMGPMGSMGGGPGPGPGPGGMYGGLTNNMVQSYGRKPRMGIGMPPNCNNVGFNPFAGNPMLENNGTGNGNNGGMMDQNYCNPNNPFSNNFVPNGGNFNNQQMNRNNRNQNRQGMNNGNNRSNNNHNRRMFKQNRRAGNSGNGNIQSNNRISSPLREATADIPVPVVSVGANAASTGTNQNANLGNDIEESWDD